MKKSSFIITLICLISLASCHKSGMNLFRGEYSIKTSGNVTLNQIKNEGDTTQPVNFEAALPNDIGQMEISTLDKNADSVLVVMNIMGDEEQAMQFFKSQPNVSHASVEAMETKTN